MYAYYVLIDVQYLVMQDRSCRLIRNDKSCNNPEWVNGCTIGVWNGLVISFHALLDMYSFTYAGI